MYREYIYTEREREKEIERATRVCARVRNKRREIHVYRGKIYIGGKYMYVCTYMYIYIYIHIYIHIYTYVCMYVCMYVYMYAYMYVCIERDRQTDRQTVRVRGFVFLCARVV